MPCILNIVDSYIPWVLIYSLLAIHPLFRIPCPLVLVLLVYIYAYIYVCIMIIAYYTWWEPRCAEAGGRRGWGGKCLAQWWVAEWPELLQ